MPIIKITIADELAQELEADRHFQALGASKFFELAVKFYLKCKTVMKLIDNTNALIATHECGKSSIVR